MTEQLSESTLLVEVTAQDIKEGVRESCEHCPIARAILRLFPCANHVAVGNHFISIYRRGQPTQVMAIPRKAVSFIALFDNKEPVEPFSFSLSSRS